MRLYELAKELGLTSKQLLSFFKSKKIKFKSNLVAVKKNQAELARKVFGRRARLKESERILKEARAAEEKARQERKKAEEKKKREDEKQLKAKRKKKEKEEKSAAKEKETKKKAAAREKKVREKKKKKTVADEIAKRLKQKQKGPAAKVKRPARAKKTQVKEVEEAEETKGFTIISLEEEEKLAPSSLRHKIRELEEENRSRLEREQRHAQLMRRRHGARLDGPRARPKPTRRRHKRRFARRVAPQKVVKPEKVTLEPPISIREISAAMGVKARDILGFLLRKGEHAGINTNISPELAEEFGVEQSIEVIIRSAPDMEDYLLSLEKVEDPPESLVPRPPVVTMLGHVDHGKTSLLDRIRRANVHEHEAGGITQHIGVYKIDVEGREVVFVDTPGHEAFTEMRARGANVTDLVVLVVAADDGVMPQTEEAIDHARAADVPIVVALNKIDKPNANRLRAKQQLASLDLMSEEWGGDTVVVEVSAVTGEGINDLLEMLLLSADLLDLKANPARPAVATVLEAKLTSGVGIVATVIVKNGTLRIGDDIVVGSSLGRARAMFDTEGEPVKDALPSTPVAVSGLSQVPEAGDKLYVVDDLQKAKEAVEQRKERERNKSLFTREVLTLENIFSRFEEGKAKELRLVLKADVKGTAEVVKATLEELSTDEVKVRILHAGVGNITESDVLLAEASSAIVIGFTVAVDENAKALAEERRVDVRIYEVIYELTSQVKAAMEGLLEPEEREVIVGHCDVRQAFRASRIGIVAGCFVLDGYVARNNLARVKRNDEVVFEGPLESLRRFKEDVREVKEGFECGIKLSGYNDVTVGYVIELYEIEKVARKLE